MRKLTPLFRFKQAGLLIALAVGSAGVIIFGGVRGQGAGPANGVELQGVTSERLTEIGITLGPPTSAERGIAISAESAVSAALAGTQIKEAVLARLSRPNDDPPPPDRLVWVVSSDTTGRFFGAGPYPGGAARRPIVWSLTFVDALTGEPLYTLRSGLH